MQCDDAIGGILFQLITVDEINIFVAAPEEEVGLAHGLALLLLPSSLLNEAPEGGQASAGADHDHGGLGSIGQSELGSGTVVVSKVVTATLKSISTSGHRLVL